MEEIFEEAPCGYFSFFDGGSLHVVNTTLCNLLGYEKEELQGKDVEILFTVSTRIFFQTHFFPLVKMQGHAEEIFISLLTKDKQHLPVLLNARREDLKETPPFTSCVFIVVANRKKFEDELVAARNAAETALKENSELMSAKAHLQQQAERLDEQVQLVNKQNHELKQINHAVTHSLKEPVRKLLLYTERLKEEVSIVSLEKNLPKISKASEQMRNIVSCLQEYVWLNDVPPMFDTADLQTILKKAEQQLENEFAGLLLLKTDDLPVVKADAKQIQTLFYHILSNAIKFRKNAIAEVSVTALLIQQNRFRALENKYKYEDFVKLQITDNGIGFNPNYREEVFELFKKLHHLEGFGLGLALCKKIVENHAGIISADSTINEGACITVLLPIDQAV